MSFASEMLDKRLLPEQCVCGGTIAYTTTRTDRFSYEKKYRIERQCLKSAANPYELYQLCVDNTDSTGYSKGDYIQIAYGSPPLLLYVTEMDGEEIAGIVIVNRPVFQGAPFNPYPTRTLNGNGSGAKISISVAANRTSCCTCGTGILGDPCA